MPINRCELPADKLRKQIEPASIPYASTAEIPSLQTVIGQDRAVDAISFALEIEDSGYNLFITGRYGTGRTTIASDLLQKTAIKNPVPAEWAFVHNFENPDRPDVLQFPAGQACKFKKKYEKMIATLSTDLKNAFESKNYIEQKNRIVEGAQTRKQELFAQLEKEAMEIGVQIKSSNMGFLTIPVKDGQPINTEDFQKLAEKEQVQINQNISAVQKRIQEIARVAHDLDREVEDQLDELNQGVASYVVNAHFAPLSETVKSISRVTKYLENATKDIIHNVAEFIGMEDQNKPEPPYRLDKYRINVLTDNTHKKGAPVIYEANPTYQNLFGRIERKAFQGYVFTDYTMIRSGSLLNANGGFLIIDAEQLLKHPFSYEALKRALRSRELHIEDAQEFYGFASTTALKPAQIPLNIKVILIGRSQIYQYLHNSDEEFRKIFKVRADFDVEVKEGKSITEKYLKFISRVVRQERLLNFDKSALISILEYAYRQAGHQAKLSIQFGELVKIIRESSFWAKKKRRKTVSAKDVEKAIDAMVYRHNLVEEKVHDSIINEMVKVDVKGSRTGQINGLAVYSLGDYSFGRPSRITVNTYIGSRGIVNIEREAKMSGRVHDKGVLVLSGYFYQKFGEKMPLSFSASITFEQNYGTIDGDSASSTELYALLSSLSGVPIRQDIAVTGSVNQKGEVQAIGGVNEKIEGFYKVCKARKLTGSQGVIIPKSNKPNLMLNNEVIESVKSGKFHIYAVSNIEEGMQILTGVGCGKKHKDGSYTKDSVFEKVRQRLVEFAEISHQFRKDLGKGNHTADEKERDED